MTSGGKRAGAGRKPEDRVTISLRVARVTKERMRMLRQAGVIIGHEIDDLVKEECLELGLISEEDV